MKKEKNPQKKVCCSHMTLVSKLSLQLKKIKQASKALQHYYVHSLSGEERGRESWCLDEGEGGEIETLLKQESFLARGARTIADHRETGGAQRGGETHTLTNEEQNHVEQSSTDRPHITHEHRQTGEPFSHAHRTD